VRDKQANAILGLATIAVVDRLIGAQLTAKQHLIHKDKKPTCRLEHSLTVRDGDRG
jgi:hypothetical protein